jgi:hypothetical protein
MGDEAIVVVSLLKVDPGDDGFIKALSSGSPKT